MMDWRSWALSRLGDRGIGHERATDSVLQRMLDERDQEPREGGCSPAALRSILEIVATYLARDEGVSYGRFVELFERRVPGLQGLSYSDVYPLLFNVRAASDTASIDDLLKYVDKTLDAMVEHPGFWGTLSCVDLMVVRLLEVRSIACGLDEETRPKENRSTVAQRWRAFLHEKYPDTPSCSLSGRIEMAGDGEFGRRDAPGDVRYRELLGEFVAREREHQVNVDPTMMFDCDAMAREVLARRT